MTVSPLLRGLAAFFLAAGLNLGPALPALAADDPITPAEKLLFMDDHLAGLKPPTTLRYRYSEQAGSAAEVSDEVALKLARGADGKCCDVTGSYLTGARAQRVPPVPEAKSNPVLLYFLEQQVRQMQQATGGQAAHFRRRIRLVLSENVAVESTRINWGGKEVPAQRITISPFVDDPQRQRFEKQAQAQYRFVLSSAVPGGVVELSARSGPSDDATRQSLTLQPPSDRK
ncbi:hypothetical protein BurJ1DRAFT_3067 [Burkholderiales bacterium JOSHI_001]|nr:hypothetical protein BurJ1DRAFT_3067 [Burkholderiales bacterium JOSHI_001]